MTESAATAPAEWAAESEDSLSRKAPLPKASFWRRWVRNWVLVETHCLAARNAIVRVPKRCLRKLCGRKRLAAGAFSAKIGRVAVSAIQCGALPLREVSQKMSHPNLFEWQVSGYASGPSQWWLLAPVSLLLLRLSLPAGTERIKPLAGMQCHRSGKGHRKQCASEHHVTGPAPAPFFPPAYEHGETEFEVLNCSPDNTPHV